ncbi:MAG: RING finger protein [Pirellulaceae bacterium]
MAVFFGIAAFLMLMAFSLVPLSKWMSRLQSGRNTFRSLAEHYSGTLYPQEFHRFPEVAIQVNGASFLIRAVASRRNRTDQVLHISGLCPDVRFRLRLTPESFGSQFKRLLGLTDVEIGDRQFDNAFVIQTNREQQLAQFLSEDARAALLTLLRIGTPQGFDLNIVAGDVDFRKKIDVTNADKLIETIDQFVHTWFEMLKNLPVLQDPGGSSFLGLDEITWLSERSPGQVLVYTEAHTAVCLVCGSEILDQRVQCRSCRTAHHRECWEYFGKCATYGCGQVRFRKVK